MDYERDLYLMQQIYSAVFTLGNKLQVKGDKSLEVLTSRQMMAMIAIIHLPSGEATHSNIARMMCITRQSERQLIDIMEKKGYVKSAPTEKDKRAVNVEITELGKKAIMTCTYRSLGMLTDMFSHFTTEDMENLWGLLKKLYCYDGEEMIGFEENMNYVADEVLDDDQLKAVKKFKSSREKIDVQHKK